uniref:Uncharacterized protein n=1 Tax=Avena sativa TaxID=4498 RepID=A0ACD5YBM4_AVESA
MSGADKVVLFGSFTEDETKLFQGQPVTETKSEEKAWELPEIQFGSLNFSTLSSEKVSNSITKGAVHSPKSTSGHAKDHTCSNKKETVASSLPNGAPVLFNGSPTVVSPNNGVLKNVESEAKVPSAGPVSNVKETEAMVPSAGPVNNVKKTEAPVPSASPVKNVKKTEATVRSTGPVKNVKKTEAMVPSAGHANNVKKTETTVPSPGAVNNVKKADSVVLSGVPVKISSSTPTQSTSSAMQVTENGNTCVDAPVIAAPVNESVTSLDNEAYQNKPLLPHGLKNTGNICFLNATLQAFLSCFPFVQLVQDLRNRSIPKVGYPTLSAFVELISQFDVLDESSMKRDENAAIISAKVVNPAMFDQVLRNFTPDVPAGTSARPRQEDAQEFLSFVMDRMHDELLKLNGSNSKEGMVVSASDDDAWETVGRKNKSAIMRTQSFVPSELSAIFGGQLQSMVKAAGNKPSATIQPFLLLHLDIFPDAVQTVEDALHLFSTPESLEGYRTAAGKAGLVTARKNFKIHALPKIMVLHLKRFSYGNHGCTKLYKPLYFPLELVLNRDLLISPSSEGRKYELVATITHHGSGPSRGHYTADAKHAGGRWLRFDDNMVMPINVNKVLHDQAYVLFYKQV